MRALIAIDPSLTDTGIAVFSDGILRYTAQAKLKRATSQDILRRCGAMAELLMDHTMIGYALGREHVEVACEWAVVRRGSASQTSPKNIIPLAAISAFFCGLAGVPLSHCHSYLPEEWSHKLPKYKGKVADAKKSPRALRVQSRLSETEMAVWDHAKYHDEIDAIGIGLHHLGRFSPRRVISR